MNNRSKDKKTALVTGASGGIGQGIALALARNHWDIAIHYHQNRAAAEETLSGVRSAGGGGFLFQADLAEASQRSGLITALKDRFARLDLLVNNAAMGLKTRQNILELDEKRYDQVMAVNLKAPFFLTQAIAAWMLDLKTNGVVPNPRIVNIGSINAYAASPNRAEFCLAKAGIAMMTRLFALQLAEDGIGVYEIRPSLVETGLTATNTSTYTQRIQNGLFPIRRWGQPEDVAKAVVAIAEGALSFSTGEVINVDGGFHLHRF